jgi:hypothetical protein
MSGNGIIGAPSERKAFVTVEFLANGEVKVTADATVNDLVLAAYHINRTALTMSAAMEQQAAMNQAAIVDVASKLQQERRRS